MAEPIIVTPTIRTPLLVTEDPVGGRAGRTPVRTYTPTTKDWWLYWDAMTRAVNAGSALLDTMLRAGTHAERLDEEPGPPDGFWVETDRDNVLYQVQLVEGALAWVYVVGTMVAAFASRPADLGVTDAGFRFESSDTAQFFRWSGVAWVDQTPPGPLFLYAKATVALTLTTVMQDIPGAAVTLPKAGRYHVTGVVDYFQNGDPDFALTGQLVSGAAVFPNILIFRTATTARATVAQQWLVTATAGEVAKLQARKAGGVGASLATEHSTIAALWVGP